MYEIPYLVIFGFFALLFMVLKSMDQDELQFKNTILTKLIPISTLIKAIPAGLAILFVLLNNNDSFFMYAVLGLALLFCMFGDIGMEKGILVGLPLFLVGQILFIVTFLGQALTSGIETEAILITAVTTIGMIIYVLLFLRYLESSEKGLGEFRIPVIVYCTFLSGMFLSTVLLWMSSGRMEFGLVALGGLLFVISDSIIAVREFHHPISHGVLKVMSTYHTAIFLLSLSCLIHFT
ncbi:MAG: lysoplasmalogenase [Candidatus Heimdallarchaeota archaeon]|nr:lysoplasmalogenase [Candidatus Heimdallarchaeota archaeon]